MKRITSRIMIGLMILFGISFTLSPVYAAEETGAPKALMTQDVYDFGTAYEGVNVYQDITIKNTGDADLEIIRIGTG